MSTCTAKPGSHRRSEPTGTAIAFCFQVRETTSQSLKLLKVQQPYLFRLRGAALAGGVNNGCLCEQWILHCNLASAMDAGRSQLCQSNDKTSSAGLVGTELVALHCWHTGRWLRQGATHLSVLCISSLQLWKAETASRRHTVRDGCATCAAGPPPGIVKSVLCASAGRKSYSLPTHGSRERAR